MWILKLLVWLSAAVLLFIGGFWVAYQAGTSLSHGAPEHTGTVWVGAVVVGLACAIAVLNAAGWWLKRR
jgi:hypothetical protein